MKDKASKATAPLLRYC